MTPLTVKMDCSYCGVGLGVFKCCIYSQDSTYCDKTVCLECKKYSECIMCDSHFCKTHCINTTHVTKELKIPYLYKLIDPYIKKNLCYACTYYEPKL